MRLRVEVGGETRRYCLTCGNRVRARLRAGTDVDAPLHHDHDEPEPAEEEQNRDKAEMLWDVCMIAATQINEVLGTLPPPDLDVLRGAEFSRELLSAWRHRRWGVVLGKRERSFVGLFG